MQMVVLVLVVLVVEVPCLIRLGVSCYELPVSSKFQPTQVLTGTNDCITGCLPGNAHAPSIRFNVTT